MNKLLIPIVLLTLITGCAFTRTIYVPSQASVRLREEVKGVKVWVKDSEGKATAGKMTLREGWFCLSMPDNK